MPAVTIEGRAVTLVEIMNAGVHLCEPRTPDGALSRGLRGAEAQIDGIEGFGESGMPETSAESLRREYSRGEDANELRKVGKLVEGAAVAQADVAGPRKVCSYPFYVTRTVFS